MATWIARENFTGSFWATRKSDAFFDMHPDLHRLQMDTHTLRVRVAWSVHGSELPTAMQMRLEREAAEFMAARPVPSPRVRPRKTKRARTTRVQPVLRDERLGCTRYTSGFRTHSFPSPNAIKTACTKIVCSPLAGNRVSFRGSVSITHNIHGKPIEPIRIIAPVLRTSESKQAMIKPATSYLNDLLFEVYVRVVSYARRVSLLVEPYPGVEIDRVLTAQPSADVLDYVLPDGLHQTHFNWDAYVREITETVCNLSSVQYFNVDLLVSGDSRSSCDSE